jgi:aldehyde dehydrogenase (NAD+)
MRAAADTMKRLVLELGGKSASLVLPDADLDAAAAHAAFEGCVRHAGQVCSLYGRLLVPSAVHHEMVDRIAARLNTVRVGDKRFEDVDMGPLVSAAHQRHVMGLIEAAAADGATVVTGGRAVDRHGFYVEPTLITGAAPDSRIAQTEVFGPVLTVLPYETVDQAVALANGTPFGLAASVWGTDVGAAVSVGERLHAGQVSVNGAPPLGSFGGHKQSGLGREHGLMGLRGYGEPITVSHPATDGEAA